MTIDELNRLISDRIQESLHLDYKASDALQKKKRDEIAKDVSAMANSDGGKIIYGITERDHYPERLDDGIPNAEIDREWIENILNSTISPKLPNITITPLEVGEGASYYVIDIPKSYSGPHQAPDKKYYKRYNFSSAPMDDYEIRDIKMRQLTVGRLVSVDVEVVHQTIFTFVVSNPGVHPAENVSFTFSEELAWEREAPRLFKNGVRYLPPGRRFQFWYLSAPTVLGDEKRGPIEFSVTANYFHPELHQNHSEVFIFDFRDFLGSQGKKDPFDSISREIKNGFDSVASALKTRR